MGTEVIQKLSKGDKVCGYGLYSTGRSYVYLEEIVEVTRGGNYKLTDGTILYGENLRVRGVTSKATNNFHVYTPEHEEEMRKIRKVMRLRNKFSEIRPVSVSDLTNEVSYVLHVDEEKVDKVTEALMNLFKVLDEVHVEEKPKKR